MEKLPPLRNRYGLMSDFKTEGLLGIIYLFLEEGKSISVFVNGQGFVYEIGDEIFAYLKDNDVDSSRLKILNCKGFKISEIPTDISIAIDGTGFEDDKWMYQSQMNIIVE